MKLKCIFLVLLSAFLLTLLSAEEKRLDIVFSSDVHGGIDRTAATFINPQFPPMLGGGGVAASLIKDIRSKGDGLIRDNLLLDAGDFFQGHPIGTVTQGKAIVEYMNDVKYDAMALGNHDYDSGENAIKAALALGKFPILSCNITDRATGDFPSYLRPYIIIEKVGVKIAIIGFTTTDTEKMSFPDNIKGVDFTDEKVALTKYVQIVRDKEGADIVIALGHAGLPYEPEVAYKSRYDEKGKSLMENRYASWGWDSQELAHEVNGIDLIIGGHMHKGFAQPWVDPITHTMVVQGYAYGSNLGWLTLLVDPETKTISGYETPALREGLLITLFEDEFVPDTAISQKIAEQQLIAEKGMDEVVGTAGVYLSRINVDAQSLMGNTICDAMKAEVNADFAFMNLGGVRSDIQSGPVTYRKIFDVMPFDNQIVSFYCTGEFLRRIIETRVEGSRHGLVVAGCNVVYSKKRENYDRVTSLKIGGQPWDPKKIYKCTTTDFLLQGNAGLTLLTQVPEDQITYHMINLRDGIVNYFRKNSPVKTKIDDRWRRDDNAQPTAEMLQVTP
jgi:5'-nucleotidase/UDP-sugar diphosphatase